MTIRIAGIHNDSIVDGPGIRLAVFTQGCPHNCKGCHNPHTHAFDGGYAMKVADIIRIMKDNPLLDGLTLSGGEPFSQPEPCARLACAAHALGLNVWAYSGWTLEQLKAKPETTPLLNEIDVLIDGPYIEAQRSLDLAWRGSTNQRLIKLRG